MEVFSVEPLNKKKKSKKRKHRGSEIISERNKKGEPAGESLEKSNLPTVDHERQKMSKKHRRNEKQFEENNQQERIERTDSPTIDIDISSIGQVKKKHKHKKKKTESNEKEKPNTERDDVEKTKRKLEVSVDNENVQQTKKKKKRKKDSEEDNAFSGRMKEKSTKTKKKDKEGHKERRPSDIEECDEQQSKLDYNDIAWIEKETSGLCVQHSMDADRQQTNDVNEIQQREVSVAAISVEGHKTKLKKKKKHKEIGDHLNTQKCNYIEKSKKLKKNREEKEKNCILNDQQEKSPNQKDVCSTEGGIHNNGVSENSVHEEKIINSESSDNVNKQQITYDPEIDSILTSDDENEIEGMFYDFEEEELDFVPPIIHGKGFPCQIKKEQKERLAALGVEIRTGKWKSKEDSILKRNFDNFVQKHHITQPHLLLGLSKWRNPIITKFIRAKKFYYQLGRDLDNRLLHSCYLRARKLFHPHQAKKASEEDLNEIKKLITVYGNKWRKIGNKLKLLSTNVSEIARWHRKNAVKGCWTEEEEVSLVDAVKKVLHCDDVSGIYTGIKWEEVAELVPTRNSMQCRSHWLLNTCWKISNDNKQRERWSAEDTVRLIYHIYRTPAEDELYVDWQDLFHKFGNTVASYSVLKRKWQQLEKKVPNYESKDHEDIISYLYHRYLPSLLTKIGKSYIEEILETT